MMYSEDFELLLAMMRLIRLNDSNEPSIGAAASKILRDFGHLLTDDQKAYISGEFRISESKQLDKKKKQEIDKEIETESYNRLVSEFFAEEAF